MVSSIRDGREREHAGAAAPYAATDGPRTPTAPRTWRTPAADLPRGPSVMRRLLVPAGLRAEFDPWREFAALGL